MKICSFLPSATEIACALGLEEELAGVSYECDYPPQVRGKPVVVHSKVPASSSAAEIDRHVREFMARGESLYRVDLDELQKIKPDLILTQDLCRVCAASPDDLGPALAVLEPCPTVLSLDPNGLADVWNDIRLVGGATGREKQARQLAEELQGRVRAVEEAVKGHSRPRVLCLEWLDPPFVAGHWVPEMVSIAGGLDVLGRIGEPSFRATWEQIAEARPDFAVIMPCGYSLEQTASEYRWMDFPAVWNTVPAVRAGRVFAVDPSSYFSRPGPRLADGLELLAHILHPGQLSLSCTITAPFRCGQPITAQESAALSGGR
ncbi:MAG: cobalamin-binding protein [Acidobacteria bacterium]|nr:cobalamin-binding protein [Acidobacteriota bacterium]